MSVTMNSFFLKGTLCLSTKENEFLVQNLSSLDCYSK
jgi:hypothetical protein